MSFQTPSTNGFLNSGREFQKFIMDMEYNTPPQESINAVIEARPFNNVLLETEFEYQPGAKRRVKISFYPQQCDVVEDTCDNDVCATGAVASPIQEWYDITECIMSKPQRLYPNDIRYVDGGWNFSQHAAQQIRAILGALRKELATRITTKIIAHKGLHLDGSEFGTRINLVYTTDGLLTPIGISTIRQEYSDGAYMEPFVLGHTQVFQWRQFYGIASVNTTLGQDFSRIQALPHMYYDVNLNNILGIDPGDAESIITFDPRALKFITFSENAGKWATDLQSIEGIERQFKNGNENVLHGTITDPVTMLVWDLDVYYKPCVDGTKTGAFDWRLSLIWDILFPPVQTCNVQGVNGIMEYKTCPQVLPTCPAGDAPSPAPSTQVYNWNPPISYPLLVSNITIGGFTNVPNVNVASDAELATLLGNTYNGQQIFTVVGSNIRYTGFSALSGSINSGDVTITFA